MSAAAQTLVVIGDVAAFANVVHVSHDSDFVQVRIHNTTAADAVYVRAIRQRNGSAIARQYSDLLTAQVEEAAALVSTPALVAWLLDSGFTLAQ